MLVFSIFTDSICILLVVVFVWRQVKQAYGLTRHGVLRAKVEYKEIIPYLGFDVGNGKHSSKSLFVPVPQLFPETFVVFFVFSFPPRALLGVLPE